MMKQEKYLDTSLCHDTLLRVANKIMGIDWDTAGWGYIGEDIASLVVDETNPDQIGPYCRRLIPAYYAGITEYLDLSKIHRLHMRDMILIKFGYRIVQEHMLSESADEKKTRKTPCRVSAIFATADHCFNL